MARQWRLRSANGKAPHYQGGGRFSICIHHKGEFNVSRVGVREYAGGVVSYLERSRTLPIHLMLCSGRGGH
ncbi:hypothetical protein L1987_03457 [Smallanthus sonchifolius]|uniref:Uncharacterized protein n=1 Tax=Smallanthus sonchifolius TaxID=185202 RepID=A0ACB9KAK6_9ASTR|nr:hypothetical protein L1987_03457 [Smallanthus sonchifolius]